MLSDPDCAQPLCRVCFGGTEPVLKASGQLISPCSCTGSVRYIHLHCLRTWQATQRAQGRHHRADCCELCGRQYAIPKKVAQQESDQQTRWAKLQLVLKRIWLWLNATAQGPMWQEALRYWRNGLLVRTTTLQVPSATLSMSVQEGRACNLPSISSCLALAAVNPALVHCFLFVSTGSQKVHDDSTLFLLRNNFAVGTQSLCRTHCSYAENVLIKCPYIKVYRVHAIATSQMCLCRMSLFQKYTACVLSLQRALIYNVLMSKVYRTHVVATNKMSLC